MPSPSRCRPRSFISWRNSLVSSGTSSSSSCANALPPPQANAKANAMAAAAAVRRCLFRLRSRMAIPFTQRQNVPYPRSPLWPGSGRFCGAVAQEGLVQEADHAGDDGHVGEVEDVPPEAEARRGEVQEHEIRHRAVGKTV